MSTFNEWHQDAEAEMQDYSGTPVVSTYGRLPLEYAAMFRVCAVMDMAQRGVVRVGGSDRLVFLNSLLTAELISRESGKPIAAGETRFSFLLERTGRIIGQMQVLETGDETLLLTDRRLVEVVAKELERYRFREKAAIETTALRVLGVFGPESANAIAAVGGPEAGTLTSGRCQRLEDGRVVTRDDLGECVAHYVLAPEERALAMWKAMVEAGATPVGFAAFNAVRIEAGRPIEGIDFDSTFLPAETGQLDQYVSFDKGCYTGQEIVARMKSRGQCPRRIVRLKLTSDALPLAGEKVFEAGGGEIGAVTSSTVSPRSSGRAICLAILKNPWFEPGREVKVPAEGEMREARVEALSSASGGAG